jgi:predicted Zn-dependent peptidase
MTAGGSYFEQKGQKGVRHLLEHCMVGRTKDLDFEALKNFLFEKDIYNNAYTGRLSMDFILAGHRSDNQIMTDLLFEFAFNPTITNDIVDREREIVLREISQYAGGPNYRLNRTLIQSIFEPESCVHCEVLGERDDVKNATLDTFETIRKQMLEQSHFIVTAVGGGIDLNSLVSRLESFASAIDSSKTLPINYQPRNVLKKFKYLPVVDDLGHDHAVINIVIPCPVTLDNRPVRAYLKELLFEDPIGVLYNRLRNELGLVYSLSYNFDISSDTLSIELACEIEHIKQIIDEVSEVFSSFDKVFSDERVKTIRDLVIKRRELNEDDPGFIVDFTVNILTDFGVIVNYEDYVRLVEQVTLDDIRKLYNTLCENLNEKQIVVVSNKHEIENLVID